MNACQSFLARLLKTLVANFTSRKFWMTLIVLWANWQTYCWVISYLYTFVKPEQIAAFVTLTGYFYLAQNTALFAYLGLQTVNNFSQTVSTATQNLLQNAASYSKTEINEAREDIQRIIKENEEKYFNDPSYAPIKKDTEVAFR